MVNPTLRVYVSVDLFFHVDWLSLDVSGCSLKASPPPPDNTRYDHVPSSIQHPLRTIESESVYELMTLSRYLVPVLHCGHAPHLPPWGCDLD
jgi:hypothetical protein